MMCEVLQLKVNHNDALLLDPNNYDRLVDLRELDIRQFTGLTDDWSAEEKELYFGDIVRIYFSTFHSYKVIETVADFVSLYQLTQEKGASFQIIGNVYQHPILLKYVQLLFNMTNLLINKKQDVILKQYGYKEALKACANNQDALDEILSGSGKTAKDIFKDVQRSCKLHFKDVSVNDILVANLFQAQLHRSKTEKIEEV